MFFFDLWRLSIVALLFAASFRRKLFPDCQQFQSKCGKLLKCSSCQYVYYCNRNCQKESWSVHKAECPTLRKADMFEWICDDPKTMDLARLMARIIFKLDQGGADELDYYTETDFIKFEDLMSHESDIKNDTSRMKHFVLMYNSLLREFLHGTQMPNLEELIEIYSKISINAFHIGDFYTPIIANAIYLGPSVINHSCKPNAVFTFEETTIIIRTLVDLPCLDWSQITISYTELLSSKKNRREKLHSLYYFWCDCERCKQPDFMAEAAACPNSLCDSPCSIDAEECEKCGTKLSEEFKKIFLEVTNFCAKTEDVIETIPALGKACLEKQRNILHRFNVQYVCTLMTMLNTAMQSQCWEEAKLYCEELIPAYIFYYGEVHVPIGVFYLTMGKIYIYLERPEKALEMLIKARSVLMITHGDKHSLVRENLNEFFQAVRFMINVKSNIQAIINSM